MTKRTRPKSASRPDGVSVGGDYVVGRGRPPKEHRFRPGRSGNPKGRPKGAKGEDAIFRKVISTRVPMNLRGRVRHVPLLDAAWMRIAKDALDGNAKAMSLLIGRSRVLDQTPPENPELDHDDRLILQSYLRQVEADLQTKKEKS